MRSKPIDLWPYSLIESFLCLPSSSVFAGRGIGRDSSQRRLSFVWMSWGAPSVMWLRLDSVEILMLIGTPWGFHVPRTHQTQWARSRLVRAVLICTLHGKGFSYPWWVEIALPSDYRLWWLWTITILSLEFHSALLRCAYCLPCEVRFDHASLGQHSLQLEWLRG